MTWCPWGKDFGARHCHPQAQSMWGKDRKSGGAMRAGQGRGGVYTHPTWRKQTALKTPLFLNLTGSDCDGRKGTQTEDRAASRKRGAPARSGALTFKRPISLTQSCLALASIISNILGERKKRKSG